MASKVNITNKRNFINILKLLIIILILGVFFGGESIIGFITGLNIVGLNLILFQLIKGE